MGRQEQGHRLGEEKRFNLMGYQMLLVFTFLTGILCISSDMITSLNLPAEGACTSLHVVQFIHRVPVAAGNHGDDHRDVADHRHPSAATASLVLSGCGPHLTVHPMEINYLLSKMLSIFALRQYSYQVHLTWGCIHIK